MPSFCAPVAAASLAVLFAAAFLPSPLYELYRRDWGLTPGEITVVFSAYSLTLIPTLLFFGSISDRIGRQRALLVGFAFSGLGLLLCAFADGLWWLALGRAA